MTIVRYFLVSSVKLQTCRQSIRSAAMAPSNNTDSDLPWHLPFLPVLYYDLLIKLEIHFRDGRDVFRRDTEDRVVHGTFVCTDIVVHRREPENPVPILVHVEVVFVRIFLCCV